MSSKLNFIFDIEYSFIDKISSFIAKSLQTDEQIDDLFDIVKGLYFFMDNYLPDEVFENQIILKGELLLDDRNVVIDIKNIPQMLPAFNSQITSEFKRFFDSAIYSEENLSIKFEKYLFIENDAFDSELDKTMSDIEGTSEIIDSDKIDDSLIGLTPEQIESALKKINEIKQTDIYYLDRYIESLTSLEILNNLFYFRRVLPGQIIAATSLPVLKSRLFKKIIPTENILISKTRKLLYSKIVGKVKWQGDILKVFPITLIKKSILNHNKLLGCSNILQVMGNIENSTGLNCKQDLYILGNLVNTAVACDGDLYVRGKINNCKSVKVKGNIICIEINDSNIDCESNILVSEQIFNSEINCKLNIVLDGKKQSITKSIISTQGSVGCNILGDGENDVTIKSLKTINVAKNKKELLIEKNDLEKKQKLLIEKYDILAEKRAIANNNEVINNQIKEINQKGLIIKNKLSLVLKSLNELENAHKSNNEQKISVKQKIFPKVAITINRDGRVIDNELSDVTFVNEKGVIVTTKYSYVKPVESSTDEQIKKTREQVTEKDIRVSLLAKDLTKEKTEEKIKKFAKLVRTVKESVIEPVFTNSDYNCMYFIELKKEDSEKEKIIKNYVPIKLKSLQIEESHRKIKIEADTIQNCLIKAQKKLNIPKEKIKYKLLQKPTKGFLGVGKTNCIIEV